MKSVAVLHAQVPFNRGGAEALVEGFVAAINRELPGVRAELIQLPFKWYPEEQILSDLMAWRLLDLSESAGDKVDLVIGTKFPSYAARHDNKVIWLVHQHRILYDLEAGPFDHLVLSPRDLTIRDKIRTADSKLIKESKGVFSISQTVTDRLLKYNEITSTPIAPPSILADRIYPGEYGDYIVCVARINTLKRQHLLIEALAHCNDAKAVFVGGGGESYRATLEQKIIDLGLQDRCKLVGFAEDKVLLEYLANSRAVFYAPFDEDYGYAAIEGFLARKPLITCNDSGEVRRFVENTGSGWSVPSDPESIATVLERVLKTPANELEQIAAPGHALAKTVTWQKVLNQIVVPYL